jgi:hypothetical protein
MKRVLLLLPTTGYRNDDFLAAANKLGVEIVAAANYCHQLAPCWGLAPIMALHFDRPEQAADAVLREINGNLDAVLAVDDAGVELAALLAERLGLPGNPAHAVRRVRDKLAFRRLLQEREFPCPGFHHLPSGADPGKMVPELKFPVVVKARRLSGSRGHPVPCRPRRAGAGPRHRGLHSGTRVRPGRHPETGGAHHPRPVRQARSPGRALLRGNPLRHALPAAGSAPGSHPSGGGPGLPLGRARDRAGPRRSAGQ